MEPIDEKKRQARVVVAERLRSFFDHWKAQLASGTEELWERVEAKLKKDKKEP